MKTFKIILTIATIAGLFACSTTRKQTTEVTAAPPPEAAPAPAPEQTSPPPVATTYSPSYTVANLGASTAGRAK